MKCEAIIYAGCVARVHSRGDQRWQNGIYKRLNRDSKNLEDRFLAQSSRAGLCRRRPIAVISLVTQTEVMATERFKIRAALSSDMVAIGEIVVQSWRHTFDGLVAPEILASLSAEQQATRHTRTFSKPETIYRVATVKG
jgi:hypothetical protein